jgi:hypothetical protein
MPVKSAEVGPPPGPLSRIPYAPRSGAYFGFSGLFCVFFLAEFAEFAEFAD